MEFWTKIIELMEGNTEVLKKYQSNFDLLSQSVESTFNLIYNTCDNNHF